MDSLSDYDYELPPDLIAQQPVEPRDSARLLVGNRATGEITHHTVRDLPQLLTPGDCFVVNETRVVPARLLGSRTSTGGRWEGLFLDATPSGEWRILSKTRGRLTSGETVTLSSPDGIATAQLELIARQDGGVWLVRPLVDGDLEPVDILIRFGHVPLPGYIRGGQMSESDRERYQTVYAREPGAVAAPTAGLHFTPDVLSALESRGIGLARVTLHVGLGTFRPIAVDSLDEHVMHSERGRIDAATAKTLNETRQRGGRIVVIGTTSVRVLETAAQPDGTLAPWEGSTDIFIRPPYRFRAVDCLMTNFHLPRSTLLVLIHAFAGRELAERMYQTAIRERYRFYSYGDAMLMI
jgi:S-adenosylmethionine:tRNA ribosyltransferase-isomerase